MRAVVAIDIAVVNVGERVGVRSARVLLVDDQPAFLMGLSLLLAAESEMEIVGHASNVEDALALDEQTQPDLVVTELLVHDELGGELMRRLLRRRAVRILCLASASHPARIAEVLRAGATSFALKSQPSDEIQIALRATFAGTRYIAPRYRAEVEQLLRANPAVPVGQLTPREREISKLMIRGYTSKAIGHSLFIAPRTVETHRHRILRKLGVHSVTELIALTARSSGVD